MTRCRNSKKAVGAFLLWARGEAEMTQQQLADRFGKTQLWVSRCETGRRTVSLHEFADWARFCGFNPGYAFQLFLTWR
jgi:transcriptional regulator with XRE-family HTH domain